MNNIRNIITSALVLTTASVHGIEGPSTRARHGTRSSQEFQFCSSVQPVAPTLQEALKLKGNQAVLFRPVQMAANLSLNFTHIRAGDGSVKPGETRGAMLVVYSSVPNEDGSHDILFEDVQMFSRGGSPVLNFKPFRPSRDAANKVVNGRCGIIAILIGLLQPSPNAQFRPTGLPGLDTISAEINSDDPTAIGLLLPAVQKVREAAARGG